VDTLPTIADTSPTDRAGSLGGQGRCPVDHAASLDRQPPTTSPEAGVCPVDHRAPAPVPATSGPASGDTFTPFACPMGFGAPASDGTSARPRKRGYFIPGLIALVAMAGIGAAVNFGGLDHGAPSRLAGSDVSTFLAQGIQAQQGLSAPPSITCPASEPVRAGLSFTCQWAHAGVDQAVHVTETTAGQFRFSLAGG
jgi:hypothetical protein